MGNKSLTYQTIVALLTSIPFSAINFDAYLKGSMPLNVHIAASLVYVALWMVYGGIVSYNKANHRYFVKFSSVYWGIAAVCLSVGLLVELAFIALPSILLFAGPLYGLRYFIPGPPDLGFTLAAVLAVYLFGLIGSLIGYMLRRVRNG